MNERKKFFNDLKKLDLKSNSRIKEIILVYEGLKPCCRIIITDPKLKELKEFCGKYKLFLEKSSFKIIGIKNTGKGTWFTKTVKIPTKSKKGFSYCYISKTKKHTKKVKKAEESENNEEFGKILGYPKCCRDFFCSPRNWSKLKKSGISGDFVLITLKETREEPPYNFYNNFVSQYFGFSLLSHSPCSFNCKRSAGLAKRYFKILQKYSKDWAENFKKYQKSAILFTENTGIFLIEKFNFKNNILKYDNSQIKSTLKNKIFSVLKEGNNIKIINKNHVMISKDDKVKEELNRKNIGICIFK